MSTGMPELGSKISLISKADIRYEGRLFTVDPQECTIALANVRSFGTEEREALYPVPAQNQIYDYILFRGSDIKDIRVVTQPALNDPAIVQTELSVPPTLVTNYPTQGFPHPVLGLGPGMGPYTQSYGGPLGGISGLGGSSMAPGAGLNRDPRMTKTPSNPVLDLIGGSRPSTPGLLSRKSPTMDAGVQCSQPAANKDDKKPTQSRVMQPRAIQPPNRDGRTNQHRGDLRERRDQGDFQRRDQGDFQRRDQGDFQNMNYRDNRNQRGPQQQQQQHPQHQQQNQQNRTGGWINRNVRQRGRGRGMMHPGFIRPGMQQQPQNTPGGPKKQPLKFDDDYDFEQANTQFEELCSKLDKSKISTGETIQNFPAGPTEPKQNGDVEKKEDSGNETGAGEGEPEEESDQVFYDKAKSFFDNISCEAVERSKGRSQRTDWRVERKLNSETFGVASARRGAYRGRGYYRGGMGGMYRGNYRGNYRGRGGQNRQQNMQQNMHTPQASTSQPAGEAAAAK